MPERGSLKKRVQFRFMSNTFIIGISLGDGFPEWDRHLAIYLGFLEIEIIVRRGVLGQGTLPHDR